MTLPPWLTEARAYLREHYAADGLVESLLWTLHGLGFDFDLDFSEGTR